MSYKKQFDLTKKFRFETAHRLVKGYEGKCANLHGHSWNGELTLRCRELSEQGMGIDFAIIKETITKKIEGLFDHATVLADGDPLIKVLSDMKSKVIAVDGNPTSEVLANFIFDFARNALIREDITNVEVLRVRLEETCTSACEVSLN